MGPADDYRIGWSPGQSPRALMAALRALPNHTGAEMRRAYSRIGQEWQNRMSARLRANAYRGPEKRPLIGNRSSTLAGSLGFIANPQLTDGANVRLDDVELRVRSDMAGPYNYAIAHEYGATIRPRNAKMLAVPLPAALTGSGVLKKPPRAYGDALFFFRGKKIDPSTGKRRAFLARRIGKGKNARLELLFVLKDSVRLPSGRLMFRETATDTFFGPFGQAEIHKAFERGLKSALAEGRLDA